MRALEHFDLGNAVEIKKGRPLARHVNAVDIDGNIGIGSGSGNGSSDAANGGLNECALLRNIQTWREELQIAGAADPGRLEQFSTNHGD